MQEVRLMMGEYKYGCDRQKTTCIFQDELVIAIVPDNLPHMLLFIISHPTVIILYCVMEIIW